MSETAREEFLRLAREIAEDPGLEDGGRYPAKLQWFARIAGRLAMTADEIESADNEGHYAGQLRAAFMDSEWREPWGSEPR